MLNFLVDSRADLLVRTSVGLSPKVMVNDLVVALLSSSRSLARVIGEEVRWLFSTEPSPVEGSSIAGRVVSTTIIFDQAPLARLVKVPVIGPKEGFKWFEHRQANHFDMGCRAQLS